MMMRITGKIANLEVKTNLIEVGWLVDGPKSVSMGKGKWREILIDDGAKFMLEQNLVTY